MRQTKRKNEAEITFRSTIAQDCRKDVKMIGEYTLYELSFFFWK